MYYISKWNKSGRKFVDPIASLFLDSTGGKKATKFIPGFYWREQNNQVHGLTSYHKQQRV